jgi:hypothetical protein
MMNKHNLTTKSKRYLRKKAVRDRYGYESERSVDRAVRDGRLPGPTLYQARFPLWAEDTLDAHDAALAHAQVNRTLDA